MPRFSTRRQLLPFLIVMGGCREPSSPRPPLAADVALRGIGSAVWEVSYIGAKWYPRVRSWAVNDSNVVVGSVQTGADARSISAFRATGGSLILLSLGNGRTAHVARGVNNAGEIVGWVGGDSASFSDVRPSPGDSAFRYRDGSTTLLPAQLVGIHPDGAGAYDINESGVIVGSTSYWPDAHVWTPASNGTFDSQNFGPGRSAVALNNTWHAVGYFYYLPDGASRYDGVSWQLLAGRHSCASDVNDSNLIVGLTLGDTVFYSVGFGVVTIGVRSISSGYCTGDAPRISNKSRVVGTQHSGAFTRIYGITERLPLPPGASFAYANSVNTCGTIAGTVVDKSSGLQRGVIWRRMAVEGQICD